MQAGVYPYYLRSADHGSEDSNINGDSIMPPTISNINLPITCDTSVLINFNTDIPAHAYIEYGTTTSYGSSTTDDTVRYYKEHAVVITGLTASTLYHYRVVATGGSTTTGS